MLVAAITLGGLHAAGSAAAEPPRSTTDPAAAAAAACVVPDDLALRAGVKVGSQDSYPHEAWMASGRGAATGAAIGTQLAAAFGSDTKTDPLRTLATGLIGTTVDHSTRQFVVVVDQAKVASVDARLRSGLAAAGLAPTPAAGLRVQAGCRPSAVLLAAAKTLAGRAWSPTAAASTFGFAVDPRTSTVHVTFARADTAAAEAARAKLGAAATVELGDVSRRDRLTDGEPHWGGAAIGGLNNRFCSAGFIVRRSDGQRGGVTAGHCFNNGNNVYSGNQFWGAANGESGYPTWDMIRVTSGSETYANRIHVDPCCPAVRTVTGGANPTVNELVCVSGYVTRAVCGIRITSLSGSLCDADGCTTGLMIGVKSGSTVGAGGDSGAPVYVRPGSSTAAVRGIEIGGTAASNFYGELLSSVTSHLGVSVATS